MPGVQITRLQALQLLLIFAAVPAQYLLSEYSGTTRERIRSQSVLNLIETVKEFSKNYFSVSSWRSWIHSSVKSILTTEVTVKIGKLEKTPTHLPHKKLPKLIVQPESVAEEVFSFRNSYGLFATSSTPRVPRAKQVKYRVGQVVTHKLYGYRGVIVGWDDHCKAPDLWIRRMHGDRPTWQTQPNYAILVDERDRKDSQTTYVVEENIEVVRNTRIKHKQIYDYFDEYDGAQYLMRPALQEVYPYD
ncbi:uncharacterized protein LOC100178877 [Ciona intestinalis]